MSDRDPVDRVADALWGIGGEEPNALVHALEDIATALRRIANGTTSGPTGLELVSMSLAHSDEESVARAIRQGLAEIADAIREHV